MKVSTTWRHRTAKMRPAAAGVNTSSTFAGLGGVVRSGDHPGSKKGFAHRGGRPERPLLPETVTGVPPAAKLHAPMEQAAPMHPVARMLNYAQQGRPSMTPRQLRRYRHKRNHAAARARR